MAGSFGTALDLLLSADRQLVAIVLLSLQVSLSAVLLATLFGLPLGALMAMRRFPGRSALVTVVNSLMGLPPVVLGLVVYLLLSRAGPLGELGLLFTPEAMILAQTLLVLPIVVALSRQTLVDLHARYHEQFRSYRLSGLTELQTLIWEGRYSLLTAVLAGFGRAIAEVGAVMIVGGNISHATRVMTTTIAMETSKGDFSLALGLGMVLILIVLIINAIASLVQRRERRL